MEKIFVLVLLSLIIFILSTPSALAASCGNGICNPSETCSSCPEDCGVCPTTTAATTTAATTTAATTTAATAIPGTVEGKYPLTITVSPPEENQTFNKGSNILVNVSVKSGSQLFFGSLEELKASTNFTSVDLKDDGKHGDVKSDDGIFANEIQVPTWIKDGVYDLKIIASQSGYITTEKIIKIKIISSLVINITLEPEYSKGNEIFFSGKVFDSNSKPITNASVSISIKNSAWTKNLSAATDAEGSFKSIFIVNFLDPAENWTFNISASDIYKNSGFVVFSVPIITPPEAGFYYIKFISPVLGISYARGETIPVAVEITDLGKPVKNANATLRTFEGISIPLTETTDGIYIGEYTLGWDEPVGKYSIEVLGTKIEEGELKGGGNNLNINVRPAKLNIDLLSPQKNSFTIGESVKISAKVLYPDETFAQSVEVQASSPLNETISLSEIEPGVYQSIHKLKNGEEGSWLLQLKAGDAYQNSGIEQRLIHVAPITVFYLLLQYWWVVAIGSSPFVYLGYIKGMKWFTVYRIKNFNEELKRIVEMKKEIQTKYFKKGSINEETYNELMKRYEERRNEIKSKLTKLKMKKKVIKKKR